MPAMAYCTCTYVHTYTRARARTHTHTHADTHFDVMFPVEFIYLHKNARNTNIVFVLLCLCMRIYSLYIHHVQARTYLCVLYTCSSYIHTRTGVCCSSSYMYIRTYVCMHVCMHTWILRPTRINQQLYVCMHAYIHLLERRTRLLFRLYASCSANVGQVHTALGHLHRCYLPLSAHPLFHPAYPKSAPCEKHTKQKQGPCLGHAAWWHVSQLGRTTGPCMARIEYQRAARCLGFEIYWKEWSFTADFMSIGPCMCVCVCSGWGDGTGQWSTAHSQIHAHTFHAAW